MRKFALGISLALIGATIAQVHAVGATDGLIGCSVEPIGKEKVVRVMARRAEARFVEADLKANDFMAVMVTIPFGDAPAALGADMVDMVAYYDNNITEMFGDLVLGDVGRKHDFASWPGSCAFLIEKKLCADNLPCS